jgi:hypothetical protein
MPVEIKELVIRITDTSQESAGTQGNATTQTPSLEALVEACVKQVLKILDKRQKR